MATSATAPKARPSSPPESKPSSPHRWWQWVLVYPALAGSLLTASPQWYDRARAAMQGIKGGSATDAERQAQYWRKNMACSTAPFAWFSNPSNVKVDATICDSGDILVRAVTPDNANFLKWVPLDDVMKSATQGGGLIAAAHAATLSRRVTPGIPKAWAQATVLLAQPQATVICQHFVDDRHVLRRVQTPNGCFDEVIDTYNGEVVKRTPAPCNPQC